jgi:mannose-6-phosphate isomerase-like protein (cupin superfamily)
MSASWYINRKSIPPRSRKPEEVVFEITTGKHRIGCGLAIADIQRSGKHVHRKTLETYTLVSGKLRVHLGNRVTVLESPGQTVTIPLNTPHWAESLEATPARISVFTIPAWTKKDHILL